MVKKVIRIEPGGHATIKNGQIHVTSKPWNCTPAQSDKNGHAYERTLRKALNVHGPQAWSLGLSGGLDSRALFALQGDCTTHIWGPSDHPDVLISRRLARIQGLEQNHFQIQHPEATECIKLLRERVGLTQAITPASTAVERSAYGQLHDMGYGILDGGFGEVVRRQFMNRVVFERMLCGDSPGRLLSSPGTGKSDIFAPEVHRAMVLAAKEQLNAAWQDLPASMTVADKADLLSIRSRLPNFFGFEQNSLDHVCVSYMPYAQPSVLRALFQVPLQLRWHGRLLSRLIRKYSPALSHIPLVKGTTQYPFGLGTVSTLAYTRAK